MKNPPKDYAKDLGRQNKQVPGFPWALLLPCSRILWKTRHGSEGRKKEWGWVLSGGKNQKVLV